MTDTNSIPAPPVPGWGQFTPPAEPAPKKKRWFTKPLFILPAAALLLGLGIGSATHPKQEPVTIEKPVEKIVTKTVEVTPPPCLTALTLSEQAFDYAGEALGYTKEAMLAASRLDSAGIMTAKGKMDVLNPKLSALAPQVNAAKASCRASAK